MRKAKKDGGKLKERAEEEDPLATLYELKQIHAQAKEMVVSEKQALSEDRDLLFSEVDRIGELSTDTEAHSCMCWYKLPHRRFPELSGGSDGAV